MTAQEQIHNAYLWIRQLYREGQIAMEDVVRLFDEKGWSTWTSGLWTAYAGTIQRQDDFPFVYLACQFFSPEGTPSSAGDQTVTFAGISFHQDRLVGPLLLGGTIRCTDNANLLNHWVVNVTARLPGCDGYFEVTGDVVRVHTSKRPLKQCSAVVQEVRSIEVPLTSMKTTTDLDEFVAAIIAMGGGDEEPARGIVGRPVVKAPTGT